MNGKLWGDDIINSLICIFITTGQEMFLENCETSKCHNFLIFQPIFKFSLFCSKMFTLSSDIKFILFWISSLSINKRKIMIVQCIVDPMHPTDPTLLFHRFLNGVIVNVKLIFFFFLLRIHIYNFFALVHIINITLG